MKEHQPNHIPLGERIFNMVWGLGLLIVAYLAFTELSFHLPGKAGTDGITFTGSALWIFGCAALVGALNLFVTIADHYDKRDNEIHYKQLSRILGVLAVLLVVASTTIQYIEDGKAPVVLINGS